jgi:hypothetical protein
MTLGEILFILTVGAAGGYYIHASGLDKKAANALTTGMDAWTRRSAKIMLQEIDFTFPADPKIDAIAST